MTDIGASYTMRTQCDFRSWRKKMDEILNTEGFVVKKRARDFLSIIENLYISISEKKDVLLMNRNKNILM